MKLLNIKLYGRRYKDTIHRALTMWFVDDSVLCFFFVCVFCFFAHLSRSDSIGRLPSSVVRCRPHTLNIISETTETTEAKFHLKPSQDGETKVCINGPGHITGLAAMPIYGRKPYFFSSREQLIRLP